MVGLRVENERERSQLSYTIITLCDTVASGIYVGHLETIVVSKIIDKRLSLELLFCTDCIY